MTTNSTEERVALKPCPFCGDADDYNPYVSPTFKYANPETDDHSLVQSGYVVECDKCAGCGPEKPAQADAITAWNTRTDNDVSGLVGWQPIESAPKDGTEVLVAGGTRSHPDSMGGPEQFSGVSIARWSETWKQWDGESVSHDDCYSHEPTHWMPLPAPPALAKHRQSNGGAAFADACLIAAARALYEALELALPLLQSERDSLVECCTIGGDIATLEDDAKPDVEKMDAVIASMRAASAQARKEGLGQ